MSRATPKMRDFAQRLIDYERENTSSGKEIPGAFHVCEKLGPHLATLMGKAGFHALLSRSLALAESEFPLLRTVQVQAQGSLAGSDRSNALGDLENLAEGGVVLVAQLLGLLAAFIGEHLLLRMLREVWPKLSLSDLYFSNGEQK